jgi:WD40 repeat protein
LNNPHDILSLDERGGILCLAYSPDESMVAAEALHQRGPTADSTTYRLRIWRTDDGTLLQDLWPVKPWDQMAGGLLWRPGGEYLLAGSRSENANIGVWNVANGRQRAELAGRCRSRGIELLEASRVVEGCLEGSIPIWDMPRIFEQINSFDASFQR